MSTPAIDCDTLSMTEALPPLLRLWLSVPRSKAKRRRCRVMRWAALDALCRRGCGRPAVCDHLIGIVERPDEHRLGLRRAAAIALIRLYGGVSGQQQSGRLQQALARGLALALPQRLSMPQLVPAMLSAAECATLLAQADAHALQRGWGSLHRQYPTVDITVDQLSCGAELRATLAMRLLPLFAERFGTQYGPASSLDFRDLFVAKYDADAMDGVQPSCPALGRPGSLTKPGASVAGQRGLDGHVDASMLSMVLQLNSTADFDGGGTRFEHVGVRGLVCQPEQGTAVLFLGKIFHAAQPILRGKRYVLVALIDRHDIVRAHHATLAAKSTPLPTSPTVISVSGQLPEPPPSCPPSPAHSADACEAVGGDDDWQAVGRQVEVRQWESGFQGSWYPATVVRTEAGLAQVRYTSLARDADEGGAILAWAPRANLRPQPAAQHPSGFVVAPRTVVGVSRLGGVWDAEVVSCEGAQCMVRLIPDDEHVVPSPTSELRPAWMWRDGGWTTHETAAHIEEHLLAMGVVLNEAAASQAESVVVAEAEAAAKLARFEAAAEESESRGNGLADHDSEEDGLPLWAGLGFEAEVWEAIEDGGNDMAADAKGKEYSKANGAWRDGEVIEHTVTSEVAAFAPEPAPVIAAASDTLSSDRPEVDGTNGLDGHEGASQAVPSAECADAPSQAEAPADRPPTPQHAATGAPCLVVQSMVRCDASPYAPSGLLVLQQRARLPDARPRPPPPTADFLKAPLLGSPVDVRHEGAWWPAVLQAIGADAGAPRYRVSSTSLGDDLLEVSGRSLRPAWRYLDGEWSRREQLTTTAAGDASDVLPDNTHGLKGCGAAEALGCRVRVWYSQRLGKGLPRRMVPCAGTVVGFEAARGLCVTFDDGDFWVGDSHAWEWLPPDAEPRCMARLPPPPPPMKLQRREMSESLIGARLRVWLPHSGVELPCVGEVEQLDPIRGLGVRLPAGLQWVDASLRWRWLRVGEAACENELRRCEDRAEEAASLLRRGSAVGHPLAAAPATPGVAIALASGMRVELCGRDDGFIGSWYSAVVQRIEGKQTLVAFEDLFESADPNTTDAKSRHLHEWWPSKRMRPVPPPAPHGFLEALLPGDTVDLRYEGGWWDVEVIRLPLPAAASDAATNDNDGARFYTVRYAPLKIDHVVDAARLRPAWFWSHGAWSTWHEHDVQAMPPPDPMNEAPWWILPAVNPFTVQPLVAPGAAPRYPPPPKANASPRSAAAVLPVLAPPKQAHLLGLAEAARAATAAGEDACRLPRALFPAEPSAAPQFVSLDVAERFVAAWWSVVQQALTQQQRPDRSVLLIGWHLAAGSLCTIKVTAVPPTAPEVPRDAEHISARLVSLDGVHSLLLYPDRPDGTLYTPLRLCSAVNRAGNWRNTLRVMHTEEDEEEGEGEDDEVREVDDASEQRQRRSETRLRSWEWFHQRPAEGDDAPAEGDDVRVERTALGEAAPGWLVGRAGLLSAGSGRQQVVFSAGAQPADGASTADARNEHWLALRELQRCGKAEWGGGSGAAAAAPESIAAQETGESGVVVLDVDRALRQLQQAQPSRMGIPDLPLVSAQTSQDALAADEKFHAAQAYAAANGKRPAGGGAAPAKKKRSVGTADEIMAVVAVPDNDGKAAKKRIRTPGGGMGAAAKRMGSAALPAAPPVAMPPPLSADAAPGRLAPPPPPAGWVWPHEGEVIEVEVDEEGIPITWHKAKVIAVLIDGWFSAHITTPQDAIGWDDWFTWREEGTDWRRPKPPKLATLASPKPKGLSPIAAAAAAAAAAAVAAAAASPGKHPGLALSKPTGPSPSKPAGMRPPMPAGVSPPKPAGLPPGLPPPAGFPPGLPPPKPSGSTPPKVMPPPPLPPLFPGLPSSPAPVPAVAVVVPASANGAGPASSEATVTASPVAAVVASPSPKQRTPASPHAKSPTEALVQVRVPQERRGEPGAGRHLVLAPQAQAAAGGRSARVPLGLGASALDDILTDVETRDPSRARPGTSTTPLLGELFSMRRLRLRAPLRTCGNVPPPLKAMSEMLEALALPRPERRNSRPGGDGAHLVQRRTNKLACHLQPHGEMRTIGLFRQPSQVLSAMVVRWHPSAASSAGGGGSDSDDGGSSGGNSGGSSGGNAVGGAGILEVVLFAAAEAQNAPTERLNETQQLQLRREHSRLLLALVLDAALVLAEGAADASDAGADPAQKGADPAQSGVLVLAHVKPANHGFWTSQGFVPPHELPREWRGAAVNAVEHSTPQLESFEAELDAEVRPTVLALVADPSVDYVATAAQGLRK